MRNYKDQNSLGGPRGESRRAVTFAGWTRGGQRKRRDGGSVGKQRLLKRRVYHESSNHRLDSSLKLRGGGELCIMGVRRRSGPELVPGRELAQNLQEPFGLVGGAYESVFTGG